MLDGQEKVLALGLQTRDVCRMVCMRATRPQIMRNTLYKAYLDDFAAFCNQLGGTTAEVMSDLLAFEADRRALNITLNSIGTGEAVGLHTASRAR